MAKTKKASRKREKWEKELLAMHRWGRFSFWFKEDDRRGAEELKRLQKLWEVAQPLNKLCQTIIEQITALEICNWKLEESILALCTAIGSKKPAKIGIGHYSSITEERWKQVWAYYLTLRNWLHCEIPNGFWILLKVCDPKKTIRKHISSMLGKRTKLKELYVERFCLALERWLSGYPPGKSAQMKAHNAAVSTIEKEIKKLDPESKVLHKLVLKDDGDGRLQPCNHKAFRRYELIISSIGAGKWRAKMPRGGTEGFKRAETLEKYLAPIEAWLQGKKGKKTKLADQIHTLLGKPDPAKVFLASLLVSLLRPQQLTAQKLAESRMKKKNK